MLEGTPVGTFESTEDNLDVGTRVGDVNKGGTDVGNLEPTDGDLVNVGTCVDEDLVGISEGRLWEVERRGD